MKKYDYGVICVLALLGGFIWGRDLGFLNALGDTVPILAGLPLFYWLGRPWIFQNEEFSISLPGIAVATSLFAAGILMQSTLLLAACWTSLLWSWVSVRFERPDASSARKLLILPFCSFPWITTDLERVGWWFRLSGASAVENMLSWSRFEVDRQGTFLSVNGFSMSVESACSGLNGLECMLIVGAALAYIKLKDGSLYWWSLPCLIVAAWAANVIRITLTALCGIGLEHDVVLRWIEPLHLLAGCVALCLMFGFCWWLFTRMQRLEPLMSRNGAIRMIRERRLEAVLLGYCLWQCRDLPASWIHNPFDRLGWLAFLVWILPIILPLHRVGRSFGQFERGRLWLMGAALALGFVGEVGDLNVCRHAALAVLLTSFAPYGIRAVMAASAIAWIPASGWVGSRLGMAPEVFACLRLCVALLPVGWGFLNLRLGDHSYAAHGMRRSRINF